MLAINITIKIFGQVPKHKLQHFFRRKIISDPLISVGSRGNQSEKGEI